MQTRLPLLGFCVMRYNVQRLPHLLIILDEEDKHLLDEYTFYIDAYGYGGTNLNINGRKFCKKLHHFILPKKEGLTIDHINQNPLDNRRCNLRYITKSENSINSKIPITNTSGYKGVSWNKKRKKWEAYITINQIKKNLGCFIEIEDASNAYKEALEKYFPGICVRSL